MNRGVKLIAIFGLVFSCILYPNCALSYADSYSVVAVVPPEITIYVNSDQQITQIASNTTLDVAPSVVLEGNSDSEIDLTSSISQQYTNLMSTCNFWHHYGTVYVSNCEDTRPVDKSTALATFSILSLLPHLY